MTQATTKETFAPFDAADYIKDIVDAGIYLELAADEDPGDGTDIHAALRTIARSKSMSALARKTGLDRSGLYKAMSEEGNPSFTTVVKVAHALGLRLRLEAVESSG